MILEPVQYLLGIFSGALVGFVLGLVGGGGSILSVPLMVYLVGVRSPHVAIGTSALAVAANAALGLFTHARIRNVKWRCAMVFAFSGVIGAAIGSTLGKAFDGQKLLFLFALVMIAVGVLMLRRRGHIGDPHVKLGHENAAKLVGYGAGSGLFSGFFGIGGGFLIVPGLIAATGMPMLYAVGSSLVAVHVIRTDDRSQLCLVGPRRLDDGPRFRSGRFPRQLRWNSGSQASVGSRAPDDGLCRTDLRRRRLHALEKRNQHQSMIWPSREHSTRDRSRASDCR